MDGRPRKSTCSFVKICPSLYHKMVEKEAKSNRNRPRVKSTGQNYKHPHMSAGDLKNVLAQEEIMVKEVKHADGGFHVLGADEEARSITNRLGAS